MVWLKVLRPRTTLMAVLLCLVSFRVANIEIGVNEIVASVYVFVAGGFTMALNDWQDRFADNKVGRSFAFVNANKFKTYLIMLGATTIIYAAIITKLNDKYGLLAFVLILIAYLYGSIRNIPLMPGIYMAISCCVPIGYAILNKTGTNYGLLVSLAIGTMFYIYGRETLKDLDDIKQDQGTKWTLPVVVGSFKAKIVIAVCFAISLIAYMLLTGKAIVLIPFVGIAIYLTFTNTKIRIVKSVTDIPFLVSMVTITIFGI